MVVAACSVTSLITSLLFKLPALHGESFPCDCLESSVVFSLTLGLSCHVSHPLFLGKKNKNVKVCKQYLNY